MHPLSQGISSTRARGTEKAKVANDTAEALTKIIVGDIESEGRYMILSDLWKVGFKVLTHYHARAKHGLSRACLNLIT